MHSRGIQQCINAHLFDPVGPRLLRAVLPKSQAFSLYVLTESHTLSPATNPTVCVTQLCCFTSSMAMYSTPQGNSFHFIRVQHACCFVSGNVAALSWVSQQDAHIVEVAQIQAPVLGISFSKLWTIVLLRLKCKVSCN